MSKPQTQMNKVSRDRLPVNMQSGMIMAVLVGVAKFTFVFDLVEKEDYCKF